MRLKRLIGDALHMTLSNTGIVDDATIQQMVAAILNYRRKTVRQLAHEKVYPCPFTHGKDVCSIITIVIRRKWTS